MSIINKMLQELDRRQGMSDPVGMTGLSQVRIVAPLRKDREWFWRIIAVLMVAAVGWVGWIAWQLQPRESVATDQALKAFQDAQRNRTPVATAPEQKPAVEKPAAPEPGKQATQAVETFRLAPDIDTPIRELPAKPARAQLGATSSPVRAAAPGAKASAGAGIAKLDLDVPPARILPVPAQAGPVRVEKREKILSSEDRAESEFRRGVGLLNQGRISESEEAFSAALAVYPAHEAARQALIAVRLEERRVDEARLLLQEGVVLHPHNTRFASVLARIYVDRRDYAAALGVMNGAAMPEAGSPEFQSMRGAILQKAGRYAEAVEAFQTVVRAEPKNGVVWMALGASLESLGRKPESADAFRSAAATGTLGTEARSYAEQRARQSPP